MKRAEAEAIINNVEYPAGFLISFWRKEGGYLYSEYIPDLHLREPPFEHYTEAVAFAEALAAKTRNRFVNFLIVSAHNFSPVGQWHLENIWTNSTSK